MQKQYVIDTRTPRNERAHYRYNSYRLVVVSPKTSERKGYRHGIIVGDRLIVYPKSFDRIAAAKAESVLRFGRSDYGLFRGAYKALQKQKKMKLRKRLAA
jgi:hypothetical protein